MSNDSAFPNSVTEERIDAVIHSAEYFILTDTLTVCVLTLVNGFTVTGESACVDPANFNQERGREYAYANARNKIWVLEGYLLKQWQYLEQSGQLADTGPEIVIPAGAAR